MRITIKHGIESLPREVPQGTTVRQVVQDPNIKAILQYSDNVRALINGVPMPDTAEIPDGATLVLETACNEKAS